MLLAVYILLEENVMKIGLKHIGLILILSISLFLQKPVYGNIVGKKLMDIAVQKLASHPTSKVNSTLSPGLPGFIFSMAGLTTLAKTPGANFQLESLDGVRISEIFPNILDLDLGLKGSHLLKAGERNISFTDYMAKVQRPLSVTEIHGWLSQWFGETINLFIESEFQVKSDVFDTYSSQLQIFLMSMNHITDRLAANESGENNIEEFFSVLCIFSRLFKSIMDGEIYYGVKHEINPLSELNIDLRDAIRNGIINRSSNHSVLAVEFKNLLDRWGHKLVEGWSLIDQERKIQFEPIANGAIQDYFSILFELGLIEEEAFQGLLSQYGNNWIGWLENNSALSIGTKFTEARQAPVKTEKPSIPVIAADGEELQRFITDFMMETMSPIFELENMFGFIEDPVKRDALRTLFLERINLGVQLTNEKANHSSVTALRSELEAKIMDAEKAMGQALSSPPLVADKFTYILLSQFDSALIELNKAMFEMSIETVKLRLMKIAESIFKLSGIAYKKSSMIHNGEQFDIIEIVPCDGVSKLNSLAMDFSRKYDVKMMFSAGLLYRYNSAAALLPVSEGGNYFAIGPKVLLGRNNFEFIDDIAHEEVHMKTFLSTANKIETPLNGRALVPAGKSGTYSLPGLESGNVSITYGADFHFDEQFALMVNMRTASAFLSKTQKEIDELRMTLTGGANKETEDKITAIEKRIVDLKGYLIEMAEAGNSLTLSSSTLAEAAIKGIEAGTPPKAQLMEIDSFTGGKTVMMIFTVPIDGKEYMVGWPILKEEFVKFMKTRELPEGKDAKIMNSEIGKYVFSKFYILRGHSQRNQQVFTKIIELLNKGNWATVNKLADAILIEPYK